MTSHRLNVYGDGYPEVWLDTEIADQDGICLGTGDTERDALIDAKEEVEAALAEINRRLAQMVER